MVISNSTGKTADEINVYNKDNDIYKEQQIVRYRNECETSVNLVKNYIEFEKTKSNDEKINPRCYLDKFQQEDIKRMKSNLTIACFLEEAVEECKNDRSIESIIQAKKTIIKIMGYRLKVVREARDRPLKTLASDMHISVSMLDKYENGKNNEIMPFRPFYELDLAENVELHYLLGLSHNVNRSKDGLISPMKKLLIDYHKLSNYLQYIMTYI